MGLTGGHHNQGLVEGTWRGGIPHRAKPSVQAPEPNTLFLEQGRQPSFRFGKSHTASSQAPEMYVCGGVGSGGELLTWLCLQWRDQPESDWQRKGEGLEKPAAQILYDPTDATEEGWIHGDRNRKYRLPGTGAGGGSYCLLGLEFLLGSVKTFGV